MMVALIACEWQEFDSPAGYLPGQRRHHVESHTYSDLHRLVDVWQDNGPFQGRIYTTHRRQFQ